MRLGERLGERIRAPLKPGVAVDDDDVDGPSIMTRLGRSQAPSKQ